jgi:hypothetical protein
VTTARKKLKPRKIEYQSSIRMKAGLATKLAKAAKAQSRSLNKEMTARLEASFA